MAWFEISHLDLPIADGNTPIFQGVETIDAHSPRSICKSDPHCCAKLVKLACSSSPLGPKPRNRTAMSNFVQWIHCQVLRSINPRHPDPKNEWNKRSSPSPNSCTDSINRCSRSECSRKFLWLTFNPVVFKPELQTFYLKSAMIASLCVSQEQFASTSNMEEHSVIPVSAQILDLRGSNRFQIAYWSESHS